MNFINAATKKERTHVEEIIKSQPVMPHEGITATEIAICGKRNLFMDVYCPDNGAEKHPIIIDIHGGGLIAGRKEQNRNLATWFAKEGYLTFVPDYRLVPETNVFGQITDVINAFATVAEHAEDFGGDLNQVFVVADSAGAFLACMASSILRCQDAAGRGRAGRERTRGSQEARHQRDGPAERYVLHLQGPGRFASELLYV